MVILGISAYYHDAAAAILVDGKIVAASCEERFSREKHDKRFPTRAVEFCLREANVTCEDIDVVVFYEKPFLKFERILNSHIQHAPKGYYSFIKAMPIWLKERLNMKRTIEKELKRIQRINKKLDIRFVEHHLSHAAMAYYTSGFDNAALLIVDAVGEKATTSIWRGESGRIIHVKQQNFPDSVGLLYSAFTYFLGFAVNSDEYKVMGLAPYGKLSSSQTHRFIDIIEGQLVHIADDGGITLNEGYFTFMYGLKMIDERKWEKIFEMPRRQQTEEINQAHMNLAAAIQHITEKILLKLAKHAKEITGYQRLCVAGGCALNCAAMGKIRDCGLFDEVFVPFAPGDDGGAIGASLYLYALMGNRKIEATHPYLGTHYSNNEVQTVLRKYNLNCKSVSKKELFGEIAHCLSKGLIVGWFQGRMEFGPRALGNRSILADPRSVDMKNRINSKVKFREAFRPFAPIVLQEDALQYFYDTNSPYMMFNTQVRPERRSSMPAVTHLDGSSRIQTVSAAGNEDIYYLLKEYKAQTGIPVLLNTSFNTMGEPIVCSPEDAIRTFLRSDLDVLVIGQNIITNGLHKRDL